MIPVQISMYTVAAKTMGQAAYERIGCAKAGCHDGTSQQLDITSSGLTEHNDLEVYNAITMGKNPEDGSAIAASEPHMYQLVGQEAMGIVAYIRSLPPQAAPYHDH